MHKNDIKTAIHPLLAFQAARKRMVFEKIKEAITLTSAAYTSATEGKQQRASKMTGERP